MKIQKKKSQQDEIDDILNEYSDNEFGSESECEGHENIDDYDF
jgi:flagellar motor switch protein FliM